MKNAKFQINPNIIFKEIDQKIVILDDRNSQIRELNETASELFLHLKKPQSITELHASILEEYDVDPKILLRDIEKFITLYVQEGLLLKL